MEIILKELCFANLTWERVYSLLDRLPWLEYEDEDGNNVLHILIKQPISNETTAWNICNYVNQQFSRFIDSVNYNDQTPLDIAILLMKKSFILAYAHLVATNQFSGASIRAC